jgi:NADH-quinone oxidoreductase subunit M
MFKDFGGLKAQMPIYAALFLIIMLSSVGLPGLNGFIGEFLALFGAFQATYAREFNLNVWLSVIAGTGVILAAVYLLWMFQKVFYGKVDNPANRRLRDLKPWEVVLVGSLVVLAFWGGVFPNTFLKPMEKAIAATQMMALNPPTMRPRWDDLTMEIDRNMNLVQVSPRVRNSWLENPEVVRTIAPANLYPSQSGGKAPRKMARLGDR